jgi:sugar lactone lactonase YvrE
MGHGGCSTRTRSAQGRAGRITALAGGLSGDRVRLGRTLTGRRYLGLAVVALFVAWMLAPATASAEYPPFARSFANLGQLKAPADVAVAPNGDIWAVDGQTNRAEEFNATGEAVSSLGGSSTASPGHLTGPKGIAVDSSGHVWVADVLDNRLKEFSESGELLRTVGSSGTGTGQFSGPLAVAVDTKGHVWAIDASSMTGVDRIEEFSAETGAFVRAFGAKGSENGQLSLPRGIAVDASGHVWVSDTGNNRIQEFSETGEFVRAFGTAGSGSGQLSSPGGLTIQTGGHVWVADTGNARIQEFSETGESQAILGSAGSEPGKLASPGGVALTASGNVVVADTGNKRVQQLGKLGEFVRQLGVSSAAGALSAPAGVALVAASNNVWVSDTANNRLQEFSMSGTLIRQVGSKGSGNGQLLSPDGLAVDASGHVWVADAGNHRIQEFSETGEFIRVFGVAGTKAGQLAGPVAVALDGKGHVFVTDANGFSAIDRVDEFSETGEFIKTFGSAGSGSGQLLSPGGIGIDGAGDVYVADAGNNRVEEFNSAGEFKATFGTAGEAAGQLSHPQGLALDPAGDVWVADTGNNRVQEFSASGTALMIFGSQGGGSGQLSLPQAVSASGSDVWVADTANNRVGDWGGIPVSSGAPTISGEAKDGVTLNATTGTWLGSPTSFTYQWERCESPCKPIEGATSSSYVLTPLDVGKHIRVAVKATNVHGTTPEPAVSLGTPEVVPRSPTNITPPVVTGTTEEGKLLTTTNGEWSGTPTITFHYGWERCKVELEVEVCVPIMGAENQTYTQVKADVGFKIRSEVVATNQSITPGIAFSAVVGPVKAGAVGEFVWSAQFGTLGTGNSQFTHPGGVAIDKSSNVWVVDSEDNRVEEFNEKGTFVKGFGWGVNNGKAEFQTCTTCKVGLSGTGNGEFNLPTGISIDPKGNIWVADTGNNRVQEFSETATFTKTLGTAGTGAGQMMNPEGVAANAKGEIWVSDTHNLRVELFNSSGTFLKNVGTQGSGIGQIGEPEGLAIDASGNVWIADFGNDRVEEFNEKAEFVRQFGNTGTSAGQFNGPDSVAVDSVGNVWVGDSGNDRLEQFNSTGEFRQQIGGVGGSEAGDLELIPPMGVAVNKANDVFVTDSGNNRIQEWIPGTPTGPKNTAVPTISGTVLLGQKLTASKGTWTGTLPMQFSYQWQRCNTAGPTCTGTEVEFENIGGATSPTYTPVGSIASPEDLGHVLRVVVTAENQVPPAVSAVSAATTEVTGLLPATQFGTPGTGAGQFSHPGGVSIDKNGNIWVADEANNRILEFNEKGVFVKGIGWGVINGKAELQVCTTTCQKGTAGAGSGELEGPEGVFVDATGNIWVADTQNSRVVEYKENGTFSKNVGSLGKGNGQLEGPEAVTVNATSKEIWVSDTFNSRIEVFKETGTFSKTVGAKGEGNGQFNEPAGLAFDSKGNLWVADFANNRVEEFSSTGTFTKAVGTVAGGVGPAEFTRPFAIATDASGNVWVGDSDNNRVEELNEKGEFFQQIGSEGSALGQFNLLEVPMGIGITKTNGVWVSDPGNNRIEEWTIQN